MTGGTDFITAPINPQGAFSSYQGSVNASAKWQPPIKHFERPVTKSNWVSKDPFYYAAPRNRTVFIEPSELSGGTQ